ncbi:hypothetical protein PROFUN_12835 [Planoprotostelium fungivorum]|uniref:Uncharacterized protein n=1 Tax=Planoprotostelium fungivorum TaxID=1890364 RepID=A0A2P6N6J2_9EUKA|nr:hypothetical protein PROFUN_12835 [Planoprotostelium fungivorum]
MRCDIFGKISQIRTSSALLRSQPRQTTGGSPFLASFSSVSLDGSHLPSRGTLATPTMVPDTCWTWNRNVNKSSSLAAGVRALTASQGAAKAATMDWIPTAHEAELNIWLTLSDQTVDDTQLSAMLISSLQEAPSQAPVFALLPDRKIHLVGTLGVARDISD